MLFRFFSCTKHHNNASVLMGSTNVLCAQQLRSQLFLGGGSSSGRAARNQNRSHHAAAVRPASTPPPLAAAPAAAAAGLATVAATSTNLHGSSSSSSSSSWGSGLSSLARGARRPQQQQQQQQQPARELQVVQAMASSSSAAAAAAAAASTVDADAAAAQFIARAQADQTVCIGDAARVQQKVAALLRGGVDDLHIISDFDMTLTKYEVDGRRNTTSHAVVANSSRTPQKMKDETDRLYAHYYPIEVSHELTPEQKFRHMEEWWHAVHAVIVDAGLTRGDLVHMVADSPIVWRQGIPDLIRAADDVSVPVLVFSAGLADVILEVLRAAGLLTPSMHVISNKMVFDDAPPHSVVGFEEPVIHVFNKNEGALAAAHVPYFAEVAHRRNVLLLGDSLGDLRMSEGMRHDACLTVGFLNHDVPQLLPQYRERYDIVLLDDAPAALVGELLQLVASASSSSS